LDSEQRTGLQAHFGDGSQELPARITAGQVVIQILHLGTTQLPRSRK
jgi:hypothetical protein